MKQKTTLTSILLSTLFSAAVLLTITSCKKDKPGFIQPAKERFPVEYRFINEDDRNVKEVILDMTTFYPYDSVDSHGDSISFLQYTNTVVFDQPLVGAIRKPDRSGYAGCTGQLKLNIWFKEALYSPVYAARGMAGDGDLAPGWTRARSYVCDRVTMQSASDGIIVFKWPSDTLKYKEVLYF
jgi:hypothetical protein